MRDCSRRSERGAIIIQVAVCLLGLTAFSAFVIDYGILWSARTQAQTAADAGAFAGSIARAFDDRADPPTTSKVSDSVNAAVQANAIWGVATPTAATEINYTCPAGYTGRCVRVTVHRDGTNSSATIPTWFASLVGVDQQHVVATATAHVGIGNSTTCMKPFMVSDFFTDALPGDDQYGPGDTYVSPGYKTSDIGLASNWFPGDTGASGSSVPGVGKLKLNDFYRIKPPDDAGYSYEDAIEGCFLKAKVGDTLTVKPGNGLGDPQTESGINNLIAQDPSSSWDVGNQRVTGGCSPNCAGGGGSPRVALIGVFAPAEFNTNRSPTAEFNVTLVNIMAVYISAFNGGSGQILGFVNSKAGGFMEAGATPSEDASFLPVIQLIR